MSYTREDNKFTTITTGLVLGPFSEAVEAMSYLAGESLSTLGVLGMSDRLVTAAREVFPNFPGEQDGPLKDKAAYEAFCAALIAEHGEFQTIPTNAWGMAAPSDIETFLKHGGDPNKVIVAVVGDEELVGDALDA